MAKMIKYDILKYPSLQLGGEPIMPGKQAQSHLLPIFLGVDEYGPQGLGSHGSSATTGSIAEKSCIG